MALYGKTFSRSLCFSKRSLLDNTRAHIVLLPCQEQKHCTHIDGQKKRHYSSSTVLNHGQRYVGGYFILRRPEAATLPLLLPGLSQYQVDCRRHFSAETYNKYFSPEVAPIGFAQKVLEGIHSATGLPWWASIALTTVALRGVITLPLAVYSMRVMARVERLQPEIAQLSQELRREVAMAVKKFGWNERTAQFKYNSTMKRLIKDLYIRDNCHPAKSSLVLWFQIPMWFCLSFALRNMSGAVPVATFDTERPAVLCPDLKTEGTLWFPDLTVPDSTWILPVTMGLANFMNIEMHSLTAKRVTRFQKGLVFVMRTFSVIMIPIGAAVPSCMCYYWMCSSLFGLTQNIVFKFPTVRQTLGLPQAGESQTPFRDMYQAARTKYLKKKDVEQKV